MPLDRLKTRTTKEILWIYLLKLLREREWYAYEIMDELNSRFGFKPARITSYVVLYRLEREGYVESTLEGNKKYYRITKRGEKLYKDGVAYLDGLVEKLR